MKLRLIQDNYTGETKIQKLTFVFGGDGMWVSVEQSDFKGQKIPTRFARHELEKARETLKMIVRIINSGETVLEQVDTDEE